MKTIKVKAMLEVPEDYMGIAEYENGKKEWWYNGVHHREDGPAIIHPGGSELWLSNGRYHRGDGPAMEFNDGTKGWFYKGVELNSDKIQQLLDLGYPAKLAIITIYHLELKK